MSIYYRLAVLCTTVGLCLFAFTGKAENAKSGRAQNGLIAFYDFSSTEGGMVKDRSGNGKPVDLRIGNPRAVRRAKGSLEIRGKTIIRTDKPPTRIIDAIRRSGELTVESWFRTAKLSQSGPARIVTLSKSANERNFTLGQDGDRLDARLRTTRTSTNGIPSISSPRRSLSTKLIHAVYTRDRSGAARLYLNGKKVTERKISGSPSNWSRSFRMALGNELSNDRPWQGTYYLVAIYNRDLSAKEVEQNFKAGAGAQSTVVRRPPPSKAALARQFDTQIVPLLARHCLECHGWKSRRGRLDLSRQETAMLGGKSGRAIVPGDAEGSLLWESVKSNEMPKNRRPLSQREKKLLKEWIDYGAVWSRSQIKPLLTGTNGTGAQWVQRLTVPEYIETVRATVGVDIAKEAREILPRDLRADGFSNTAYNLTVDLGHIEAYAKLAEIIVKRMDVKTFVARYAKGQDFSEAQMRKVISGMGKWLLRGPLEEQEIQAFLRISRAVAKEGGNFTEAVSFILEAMLQAPRFIYRMEKQNQKAEQVGSYELASRFSYILWGGPPDAELFRAAEAGELDDARKRAAQVDRMLKDPRVITRSSQFIYEWLDLDRLENLRPNPKKFPKWNSGLATDMREETIAFFKEVVWKQNRPLSDLLNAQVTFSTPRLAAHYGFTPQGQGLSRYDLSKVAGRGGLLTQGSVLTVGGDEASMVSRGLFVLHDLLEGKVDDPPPCVDTTPVPTKPGLSQRSIALARLADRSCGGCHSRFEPLAFGLEKFDGLGSYHEKDEHGNQLREDGEILFPGEKTPVAYKTAAELMNLLAKSDRVQRTIERKVAQFALGRPLVKEDEPHLARIHEQAQKQGGTYASLIRAIVLSDLVRMAQKDNAE